MTDGAVGEYLFGWFSSSDTILFERIPYRRLRCFSSRYPGTASNGRYFNITCLIQTLLDPYDWNVPALSRLALSIRTVNAAEMPIPVRCQAQ
jgi:hypothetical protein